MRCQGAVRQDTAGERASDRAEMPDQPAAQGEAGRARDGLDADQAEQAGPFLWRRHYRCTLRHVDLEQGVVVTQTGCMGLCEKEPIVQVTIGEQPKVTYGKVNPEVARKIVHEHVVGGKPVADHVIPM